MYCVHVYRGVFLHTPLTLHMNPPEHEGDEFSVRLTVGLVSSKVNTNENTKSANCVEYKAAIYVLYVSLHRVHSFKLTRPSLSRA